MGSLPIQETTWNLPTHIESPMKLCQTGGIEIQLSSRFGLINGLEDNVTYSYLFLKSLGVRKL